MQHPIGGHHGGGGAGREIAAAGPQTRRSHGAARVQAEARTEIVGFVLTWKRPNIASPGIPLETTLVVAGSVDIGSVPDFLELVDAISIPTQGVLLCLYAIKQDGWCKACARAEPDIADQVARYGADTAVTDWARRLRC
jgi:hypothetical protein